jgi:hypothetical protein
LERVVELGVADAERVVAEWITGFALNVGSKHVVGVCEVFAHDVRHAEVLVRTPTLRIELDAFFVDLD